MARAAALLEGDHAETRQYPGRALQVAVTVAKWVEHSIEIRAVWGGQQRARGGQRFAEGLGRLPQAVAMRTSLFRRPCPFDALQRVSEKGLRGSEHRMVGDRVSRSRGGQHQEARELRGDLP